ncbi:MAG: hypothetical protein JO037_20575, partial [Actinobacteria bacterium]|nr:hypothetical protein [Actinomycetota bacterium]
PPTQAEKVPSIPDLPIAPASPIADQGTDNSIAQGVNPLVKASTTGIQQTLDGDTASTAPQQPPNPLNSNVSPPTIGVEVFQPGPQGWVMPANQPNPYGLIITGF